jgi:hypothetical protein
LDQNILAGVPATFDGGFDSDLPSDRIMDALGSETNTQFFVLLRDEINGMKAKVRDLRRHQYLAFKLTN